jgi:hypothetical protein
MYIKLMRGTFVNGKRCRAGDTVETTDKDGRYLINSGFAEESAKPKKPAAKKKAPVNKAVPVEDIETRDA